MFIRNEPQLLSVHCMKCPSNIFNLKTARGAAATPTPKMNMEKRSRTQFLGRGSPTDSLLTLWHKDMYNLSGILGFNKIVLAWLNFVI